MKKVRLAAVAGVFLLFAVFCGAFDFGSDAGRRRFLDRTLRLHLASCLPLDMRLALAYGLHAPVFLHHPGYTNDNGRVSVRPRTVIIFRAK